MEINYTNYLEVKSRCTSRAQIAEIFNIPEWKLKKIITANKWGKPKCIISNMWLFDTYSEISCYWAGFIAADGNVDSKNRIRIMLKYDDLNHLQKFKDELQSTHAISSNTAAYSRCSFEFTSSYIKSALQENFKIVPNKTAVLEFPDKIPEQYMKDYIRGYFDGDGSICESFSNRNSITASLYATFASGCEEFIINLYNYLRSNLGVNGHLQAFKDSIKWQIKFNTNDAKILLHYMYYNSLVYLDRKYSLYQQIVINDLRLKR